LQRVFGSSVISQLSKSEYLLFLPTIKIIRDEHLMTELFERKNNSENTKLATNKIDDVTRREGEKESTPN